MRLPDFMRHTSTAGQSPAAKPTVAPNPDFPDETEAAFTNPGGTPSSQGTTSEQRTNAPRTELVFILDKSGSMAGMEGDTIGGFNSMLAEQRKVNGPCRITTVLFNNDCHIIHDRARIKDVTDLTSKEYFVGGNTALLDAIGSTIKRIVNSQRALPAHRRADRVLFVIITDGYENASYRYSLPEVKRLIEKETNKYGWEFIFLGANIDAISAATSIGIRADRAQNYLNDVDGNAASWSSLRAVTTHARMAAAGAPMVPTDWDFEVAADYAARSRK